MKKIFTGSGYISMLTLLAIWSMSLVVDLPGLAVSPVMSVIDKVFPRATHLECQMLEILPNFFIFPFILLSGKLSMSKNKLGLVVVGLALFFLSGVAYLFADSIVALIVISCFIGMGCGLVIPLAAGFLAEIFTGKYRMQQLGIKSGIANLTLVIATAVVGVIEGRDWHTPFVVYLIAGLPLLMAVFLTKRFVAKANGGKPDVTARTQKPHPVTRKMVRDTWGVIAFYLIVTIAGSSLSFFIPFLMQKNGMSDAATGYVSASFYLALTVPGFMLNTLLRVVKNRIIALSILVMVSGLVIIPLLPHLWAYFLGSILLGLGYGTLQPIFYNKAAILAPSAQGSTRTLSYVMSSNYLGVAICPLFFAGLKSIEAFVICAIAMGAVLVLSLMFRRWFVFNVNAELAEFNSSKHVTDNS